MTLNERHGLVRGFGRFRNYVWNSKVEAMRAIVRVIGVRLVSGGQHRDSFRSHEGQRASLVDRDERVGPVQWMECVARLWAESEVVNGPVPSEKIRDRRMHCAAQNVAGPRRLFGS